MKKLVILTAAALLATSALVYAGNDHDKQSGSMQKSAQSAMMMGMSGDMQAKMAKMKADMMAIQKVSDPAKRKALMKAHMKNMHSSMGMMKNQQLASRVSMLEAMVEQMMVNQINALDPSDPVYTIDSMDE
jgi:hypothetical protein